MKSFKFRRRAADGSFIYRTIELPDDTEIFIGKDCTGCDVYEGDCVSVPKCFCYATATLGIRGQEFRLKESSFSWQKTNPKYFFGSFVKPEPPPKMWSGYHENKSRGLRARKFC
ncbi:MAG: hypothetical protein IJG80_09290 [Selenomonadaceae bacterium]|nr:hypothetical protein [Selenomonadaceae bacterium]MBQ3433695.1 hypothetical protein [Selenomonadaceae bacterium]